MYDWVGSLPYGKGQLQRLRRAGARVTADAAQWQKLNCRNHRKIAVIDGRIGYTGGMNMGQEYIDGKPRYDSWRDTHVRFTGPLVAELQRLFCERWMRTTNEDLFGERYFPEIPPAAKRDRRVGADRALGTGEPLAGGAQCVPARDLLGEPATSESSPHTSFPTAASRARSSPSRSAAWTRT